MVELFKNDIKEDNRKSSKGNQLKWLKNNVWYKADYTGYEGLSEYIIAQLLKKSTLDQNEFVEYEPETIKYNEQVFNGCRSKDFLNKGQQLITLERLYHTNKGKSLYRELYRIDSVETRLEFLTEQIKYLTGLNDFGKYMSKLLTIDALFLNEDRHMHNIAVIMNSDGNFAYCPIFDNGAGLLSDTKMDYPLGKDIYTLIGNVTAKTIDLSFEKQLDVAEKLYGYNLKFHFTKSDIEEVLQLDTIYDDAIKERVFDCICEQMRKYRYLFQ